MNDERLLRLLRRDPERGIRALVDMYGGLVYSVVRGVLQPSQFGTQDVEACVADAVSEFYLDLERFDPSKGGVRGWLCVIAKHNALDTARKRARELGSVPLDDGALEFVPDGFSLESDIEARAEKRRLAEAIEALGEPDREIIVRKYYLGQPSALIAEKLGMTVSNVDTRTHRAVKKLRHLFGGDKK